MPISRAKPGSPASVNILNIQEQNIHNYLVKAAYSSNLGDKLHLE